jgi:chromosome segregation ATPase
MNYQHKLYKVTITIKMAQVPSAKDYTPKFHQREIIGPIVESRIGHLEGKTEILETKTDYLQEQLGVWIPEQDKLDQRIGQLETKTEEMEQTLTQREIDQDSIAYRTSKLETKIHNQNSHIKNMALQLERQELQLERQEAVILQLIAGLFNQGEQTAAAAMHMHVLHGTKERPISEVVNTSRWGYLPTTRQGDLTEKKMAVFEKNLAEIRAKMAMNDA